MYSLIFASLTGRVIFCKVKLIRSYSKIQQIVKSMPRGLLPREEAVRGYEKRKMKIGKYESKSAHIHVIGSGAHGTPSVVSLVNENTRYLFNCGEGTQRICSEWKAKISRFPHIFVTYPSWKNLGGLIGYCLSVENIGIPEIHIHGPPCVKNFFFGACRFVSLRKLQVTVIECDPNQTFTDGIFNIKSVNLYPDYSHTLYKGQSNSVDPESEEIYSSKSAEKYEDEISDDEDCLDYYSHLGRNMFQTKVIKKGEWAVRRRSQSEAGNVPQVEDENYATSFICQTPHTKGRLLVEKCLDTGLRPGPMLGRIKRGEDIELEDGKVLKACEFLGPDTPGAYIIVIEIPAEEYLDALLKEPAFLKHQTGAVNPNDIAELVIHLSSSHIIKHPKYQEWMNRFPTNTKHTIVNEENVSMGFYSIHEQQYLLHQLHPEIFPLLYPTSPPFFKDKNSVCKEHTIVGRGEESRFDDVAFHDEEEEEEDQNNPLRHKIFYKCNSSYIKGETACQIYVRPVQLYDFSLPAPLTIDWLTEKVNSVEGLKPEIEKLKNELVKLEASTPDKREYPKILFLGTGSSIPNKKRNVSGIIVFLDEDNAMILDCGEGTYGQLVRFYGRDKAREVLQKIKIIYISHIHADHHMGLVTLLKERMDYFMEKVKPSNPSATYNRVTVLGPHNLLHWLSYFDQEFGSIKKYFYFISHPKQGKHQGQLLKNLYEVLEESNIAVLETTLVKHCPNAFGVAIIHNDGWKLTYSGDTRPCQNLIDLGKDSDILIHEATMSDVSELDAAYKLHSTISQAIEVGQKMNAKFILLTHFSQRFASVPILSHTKNSNVGLAFDNMMVSMKQLQFLPLFYDALKAMFFEKYEKTELRLLTLNSRKRKPYFKLEMPAKLEKIS